MIWEDFAVQPSMRGWLLVLRNLTCRGTTWSRLAPGRAGFLLRITATKGPGWAQRGLPAQRS
jgi:hypothetical protein